MAYFDNAATTYPKPEIVYSFMNDFYRHNGGNAGRGDYKIAQSAGKLIDETRGCIQNLLHCPAKQVVFEPTATLSLNIIIQGLIQKGVKNIYITPFEHNAVTRTLHHYELLGGIKVRELFVSDDFEYDLERIKYQFDANSPDLVIVSHASNVTGLIAPVIDIFTLAKEYNSFTLVDMAQTAGLVDCNIGLDCFDFAVFAGHKTLYGPTGASGFVMKPEINLPSVLFGGTGYDSANQDMPDSLPERFEFGTANIMSIAGLNAALKWIDSISIESLSMAESEHRRKLIELLTDYDYLTIVGNSPNRNYVGIVSCLFDGISSDSAGDIFSSRGIAVRTGLHCAPNAHKFLNTFPAGTIRFSVNALTAEADFIELRKALDDISDNL